MFREKIHEQLETDCRYSGYLARQEADISAMRRDEALIIPAKLTFSDIGGLSAESQDLLSAASPRHDRAGRAYTWHDTGGNRCSIAPYKTAGNRPNCP